MGQAAFCPAGQRMDIRSGLINSVGPLGDPVLIEKAMFEYPNIALTLKPPVPLKITDWCQIYAAVFCCARTLAHRALCAAAIFRRAAAERILRTGALPGAFAVAELLPLRALAHRALWA